MAVSAARQHLVIFARQPQYGVGKRRLAAEVGELAASRFQRFALRDLLRGLGGDPRWRTWIAVTPDRPIHWLRNAEQLPQGRGDLGERLRRVASRLPKGAIVILGSDAPQVTAGDVATAFRALGGSDAVIGPAVDGGYWLVGLSPRQRAQPPFANVRWSTPDALTDTLENLKTRRIRLLRELEDVDDAASLRRLCAKSKRLP